MSRTVAKPAASSTPESRKGKDFVFDPQVSFPDQPQH